MQRRESAWIEPLVSAFSRPAFRLAAALVRDEQVAEDIVQEAFLRVFASPNTPRDETGFKRWLYRIVVNLARQQHRQRARWLRLPWQPAPQPDPQLEAERHLADQEMAAALRLLSPREREAVYLRYFEDESFQDVAATMDIGDSTARVLVHRGLVKLRERLESAPVPRGT